MSHKPKLEVPENFVNREISWLKFNNRVLKESTVKDHPPLERLRFISIACSNLDEFFMVRVANTIDKTIECDFFDPAGLTAFQQLQKISVLSHSMIKFAYKYLFLILKELRSYGIFIERFKNTSETDKEWLEHYFMNTVYPVLTPLAIDASHPFPHISNKSIHLAVNLTSEEGQKHIAFVQVPSVLPRLLKINNENDQKYTIIFLEELIMNYCHTLFPGYTVKHITPFRITRDSDIEINDYQADDLLTEMEKSLYKRKRGDAVRLEINDTGDEEIKEFLLKNLSLEPLDVYYIKGPLDITCFNKLINDPKFSHLCYTPQIPQIPADLIDCDDIFSLLKEKDVLLHHPFESFEPTIELIQKAANDPNVLAIKQTLYRVSGNSPIVYALAKAAENGKQVTVLVELKARFDEENNITWAKSLEKSGCHVIYGLVGLKTHSKIVLIVRQEEIGIKRYVHLSTGNYNDNTAKLYTDIGLLTSNEQIGADASAFFNLLSGYSEPPLFDKLTMAPIGLREKFYQLIDNEIAIAKKGRKGHIIAKMNSLIDKDMILKLYEASNNGVKIDLVIRGICGLKTGKHGVSENIFVRSIVGRYLEHSRIFYFHNDGEEQVYLSSADWMERNLNDRVELLFPIDNIEHVERIKNILQLYLKDNCKAHILLSSGIYRRLNNGSNRKINSQEILYKKAYETVQNHAPSLEQKMKPLYKKELINED